MTIEELQDLPYGAIHAKLDELAPQVLATKARYDELAAEQRLYLAARNLAENGVRIGDKVQLRGSWSGKKNPIAVVCGAGHGGLYFQVLRKDGQPHGEPQSSWIFDGFEKLE